MAEATRCRLLMFAVSSILLYATLTLGKHIDGRLASRDTFQPLMKRALDSNGTIVPARKPMTAARYTRKVSAMHFQAACKCLLEGVCAVPASVAASAAAVPLYHLPRLAGALLDGRTDDAEEHIGDAVLMPLSAPFMSALYSCICFADATLHACRGARMLTKMPARARDRRATYRDKHGMRTYFDRKYDTAHKDMRLDRKELKDLRGELAHVVTGIEFGTIREERNKASQVRPLPLDES